MVAEAVHFQQLKYGIRPQTARWMMTLGDSWQVKYRLYRHNIVGCSKKELVRCAKVKGYKVKRSRLVVTLAKEMPVSFKSCLLLLLNDARVCKLIKCADIVIQ